MQSVAWSIGWVLGPVVGGAILDSTDNNYSLLMMTTVGFYVVSSILTYVLLLPLERRHDEQELESSE
jgi:MFS family permease